MNKRIMKLTIVLLAAIVLTVPLIGSTQAFRNSRENPITLERVRVTGEPGYVDFFGDSKNAGSLYIATPLRSTETGRDGLLTFVADGTTIDFSVSQTDSYIIANLETLTGHTMTKWTLTNDDGGFEGTLLLKTTYFGTSGPYGPPPYDIKHPNIGNAISDYKAVLIGYGAYKGQKIVLSGNGPYSGPYEGLLIAK
jgi:hypothetical protein